MRTCIGWNQHIYCHLFSKPRGPFCTSTFTSKFLIAFLIVLTREKKTTSPLCILSTPMHQIVPSYTHVSSYTVWRGLSPWVCPSLYLVLNLIHLASVLKTFYLKIKIKIIKNKKLHNLIGSYPSLHPALISCCYSYSQCLLGLLKLHWVLYLVSYDILCHHGNSTNESHVWICS